MKENKTKPDIRFKGFTEAWEQRKLIDLCDYVDYRGKTPNKSDSGIFLVTAKNVKDGYIDYDVSKEYIPEDKYEEVMRRGKPKIGDVLITTEAPCGNVAQVNKPNIALAQRIIKYRGHNQVIDNTYLKYYLLSPFFQNILNMKSSGGTVQGIKGSVLHQQKISFTKYTEQLKIGQCLDSLDSLITLHQRECDQLKELKKSMLKKMFPRDESSIPEVRFAGFTDAWEQRKLGDVTQIIMGQSPDGSTYSEKPKDYILVQGNSDIKDGWVEPRLWTTQMTKKADVGDLIMSVRAPAGSMGKTAYNVVIGRGVAAIKGNEFIFQSLIKKDIEGFWKKITTGSTFESLNSNDIKNSNLLVPVNEEQIKIGQYFSQLDNLITLHQRELEILKNLKKTCLKRMFI